MRPGSLRNRYTERPALTEAKRDGEPFKQPEVTEQG